MTSTPGSIRLPARADTRTEFVARPRNQFQPPVKPDPRIDRLLQIYARLERLLPSKLLRFVTVGGTATGVQYVLLIFLVEVVQCPKVAASASAYLLAALVNYLLNYYLTFRSKQQHWVTLPKFVLVVALGVTINTSVFSALVGHLPYLIAQVVATVATLISNFLLHKHWIYRERAREHP